MRRLASLVVAVLICALALPAAAQQKMTDEQQIRQLDRDWNAKVAAKDLTGAVSFYAKDGVMLAPGAPAARGTAAITEMWKGLLGLPNSSLSWEPTLISVSKSKDVAYEFGTYSMAFDSPKGRVQDKGKYATVWKKEGGKWKAVVDMINTDLPNP
jgi:uncharacterized protein (TIGR02246 family)